MKNHRQGLGSDASGGFAVPISALGEATAFLAPIRSETGEVVDFRFEQMNSEMQALLGLGETLPFSKSLAQLGLEQWLGTLIDSLSGQLVLNYCWRAPEGGQELELRSTPLWFGLLVVLRPMAPIHSLNDSTSEWFEQLLGRMPALVAVVIQGKIQWLSESVSEQLGWTPAELKELDAVSLVHPEDSAEFRRLQSVANGGSPICLRHRFRHRDGEYRWLETSATSLMAAAGVPALLAAGRIVDDSVARETELKVERDFLGSLIDELPVGVFRLRVEPSGERKLEYANERLLADVALQQVFPLTVGVESQQSLVHPDDQRALSEAIELAVDTAGELNLDLRVLMPEGTRWLRIQGTVLEGRECTIIEGVQLDVTLQKAFEEQLREAESEAKSATAAKSNFLANMTHEIRTPLTAVLGFLELLRTTTLSSEQLDFVLKAERSAHSLLAVVNDILDFSKIEAGRFELRQAPFEMEQVLRDVAAVASTHRGEKPVDLYFEVSPEVPNLLIGDGVRVRQVLINLVSNAAKFTEVGMVRLSVKVAGSIAGKSSLVFRIEDTGVGMTPQTLARVLEDFVQGEDSKSRRYQGTGLGLSLSRRLIEIMGSQLALTSESGRGTTAEFSLTFELPAEPEMRTAALQMRIALLNQHAASANDFQSQCQALGWVVDLADNLEGLCEQLSQVDHTYDVVVVETRQPSAQLTREILRIASACEGKVPIVLVAGNSLQLTRSLDEVAALTIDGSLTRPFTNWQLIEEIERVVARQSSERKVTQVERPLVGLRILMAEDSELTAELATNLLTRAGGHVTHVTNGAQAVEAIQRDLLAYDLVLMDVQMPVMDGIEATRSLRKWIDLQSQSRAWHLPIIGLTANALSHEIRAALQAGMDQVITKPFTRDALIKAVSRWTTSQSDDERDSDMPSRTAETPILGVQAALQRLGNDRANYRKLVERLAERLPDFELAVNEALAADNRVELARQMHRLRGVAAMGGAEQLAKAAAEVERLVSDGAEPECLAQATSALLEVVNRTLTALNTLLLATISQ